MEVLVLGFICVLVGVAAIRYVDLSTALKEDEAFAWSILGGPAGYSFSDFGVTLGLFSWLLNQGYDHTDSDRVREEARKAVKRARFSKYALLTGVTLISVGFPLALLNAT